MVGAERVLSHNSADTVRTTDDGCVLWTPAVIDAAALHMVLAIFTGW
jgi:hypothetical protein